VIERARQRENTAACTLEERSAFGRWAGRRPRSRTPTVPDPYKHHSLDSIPYSDCWSLVPERMNPQYSDLIPPGSVLFPSIICQHPL
jgi:hypothetical protein